MQVGNALVREPSADRSSIESRLRRRKNRWAKFQDRTRCADYIGTRHSKPVDRIMDNTSTYSRKANILSSKLKYVVM